MTTTPDTKPTPAEARAARLAAQRSGSLDARLATTRGHLESATAEYGVQSLALTREPDSIAQQKVVAALAVEMAEHTETIRQLEAAIVAAGQGARIEDLAAKRKFHEEQRAVAQRKANDIARLARLTVAQLEGLAPLLAELEAAINQRRTAVWSALVASVGGRLASAKFEATRQDGTDIVTCGLLGAVTASGIAVVGPSLAPHVIVSPPVGSAPDAYGATRMLERLAANAKHIDNLLAGATP